MTYPTHTIRFTSTSTINIAYQIPEKTRYTEATMQKAMQHARRQPDIPIRRLAELYDVDKSTLGHRVKGKQVSKPTSHRNEQLFSPDEESAIIDHCDLMGKLGFPVSKAMLVSLAQDMLNK